MARLSAKEKQARFIEEYLIDLNGTQAAIRAGYSPLTAKEQASQLLTKLNIRTEIDKAIAARSKRTGINQDRVLQEIAKMGLANMRNFVNIGPDGDVKIKCMDDISPEDSACIKKIEARKVTRTSGDDVIEDETIKIELHDKKGCLELLGRHLGMFKDDDDDAGKDVTINIVYGTPPATEGPADG